MKKKAILVVSFGTTNDRGRANNIDALSCYLRESFPDYYTADAFTSGMVIRALGKRGIEKDTVRQALAKLAVEQVEEVFIQPSHIIAGIEYEKLLDEAKRFSAVFSCLTVANPLLTKTEDYVRLAEILNRAYAVENGEALVLMGHGTSHGANAAYPAFDYICRDKGYRHIFIGTVEGYPCKQDVIRRVNEAGFTRVLLAPLMLVAGDHAVNDMAGAEPESWKNSFAARGYQVRCLIRGLGELAEVRQLYRDHLSAVLTEQNQEING